MPAPTMVALRLLADDCVTGHELGRFVIAALRFGTVPDDGAVPEAVTPAVPGQVNVPPPEPYGPLYVGAIIAVALSASEAGIAHTVTPEAICTPVCGIGKPV